MTNLIFRFSELQDDALSKWGPILDDRKVDNEYEFVQRYQKHWLRYNEKVFRIFEKMGFNLPNEWVCYFVNARGFYPYSDPLTIPIKKDFDEITATLIHELCHVVLSYEKNRSKWESLSASLNSSYRDEDWNTQVHIMVNIMSRHILSNVFDAKEALMLIKKEKEYHGLKRAWEIVESIPESQSTQQLLKSVFIDMR